MRLTDVTVVDVSADHLLLRAVGEPGDYTPPAWPTAPGPVVACTPGLSRRPDLVPVLRAVLPELLGGSAHPVRLLLAGGSSASHWSDEWRMLGDDLGMPVLLDTDPPAPVAPTTVDTAAAATVDTMDTVDAATTGDMAGPPPRPPGAMPAGALAIGAVSLLAPRRWDQPASVSATAVPDPAVAPPAVPEPLPPVPSVAPLPPGAPTVRSGGEPRRVPAVTLDPADVADDEWPALRLGLPGSYDAHARVVTRALSEQPGLRGTGNQPPGGLIAVRAVCSEQREPTRRVLRRNTAAGQPTAQETAQICFLARAARQGLRRLPTVLGPVFRPATVSVEHLAAYRQGAELLEPSFVDGDLIRSQPAGATVEFAIWSHTGRRVDVLAPADARPVLFAPGTVFRVLAVDRAEDGPIRVLLTDPGVGESDDRIVASLRTAAETPPGTCTHLDDLAIGLHDDGPFVPGP